MKAWLKGGIIGLIIGFIVSFGAISIADSISEETGFLIMVIFFAGQLYPINFFRAIPPILIYTLIGAIIGWIVGKIKSRK